MNYLVDIGELIFVSASSPADAFELARLPVFGEMEDVPKKCPDLYQVEPSGEIYRVNRDGIEAVK